MASPTTVIADATPLIVLGWINQLELLRALFGRVVIPPAVAAEVSRRGPALPEWVHVQAPSRPIDARIAAAQLGAGETEALSLALELPHSWVILDDGEARVLGRLLGVNVLGTGAVLVNGKRAGLIPAVRPVLDALLDRGFRLSPEVYDVILKLAGEVLDE